jgi:hypothetical protein
MWDTGATNTVISRSVVHRCRLEPSGVIRVRSIGAVVEAESYLVNLILPNLVHVPNLSVTEGEVSGFDVIIGMDVIALGDFAITNFQGQTVFSFRVPSLGLASRFAARLTAAPGKLASVYFRHHPVCLDMTSSACKQTGAPA